MSVILTVLISLLAMVVWELLRKVILWLYNFCKSRGALKKLFTFNENVSLSRSILEKEEGKQSVRVHDAFVEQRINRFIPDGYIRYEDQSFSIENPASHLIVTGSIRYNEHAKLLQKYFDLPYEYLFSSSLNNGDNRILKIVTEHGDEFISSIDHRVSDAESEVDYGILFLGNLKNNKKVIWLSGIHGEGTFGVFRFLEKNVGQIGTLKTKDDMGKSWLIRVQYRKNIGDHRKIISNFEQIGEPKIVYKKSDKDKPNALICDLGNVLMYFDRTRTYRAIAYLLETSYTNIQERIEKSDLRNRYEKGALSTEEFCIELSTLVEDKGKLSAELISEFWGDIFWPNFDIFESLKKLKDQGLTLVLLSNTNELHFHHVKKHYQDYIDLFDEVVLSYEEKKAKPDRTLFEIAIDRVRKNKKNESFSVDKVLYVDDEEEYVKVAKDLGMKGFVFRSYSQFAFRIRKLGLYFP